MRSRCVVLALLAVSAVSDGCSSVKHRIRTSNANEVDDFPFLFKYTFPTAPQASTTSAMSVEKQQQKGVLEAERFAQRMCPKSRVTFCQTVTVDLGAFEAGKMRFPLPLASTDTYPIHKFVHRSVVLKKTSSSTGSTGGDDAKSKTYSYKVRQAL